MEWWEKEIDDLREKLDRAERKVIELDADLQFEAGERKYLAREGDKYRRKIKELTEAGAAAVLEIMRLKGL